MNTELRQNLKLPKKFTILKKNGYWIGKSPFGMYFYFNDFHYAIYFCDRIMRCLTANNRADIWWTERILEEFTMLHERSKLALQESL